MENSILKKDIERLLIAIDKKLNSDNSGLQNSADYQKLNEEIFKTTGEKLSNSSLIEIFTNDKIDSVSTISLLNQLCRLLGYSDWVDFQKKNTETAFTTTTLSNETGTKKTKFRLFFWASLIIYLLLTAVLLYFLYPTTKNDDNLLIFEYNQIKDNPCTVKFVYDITYQNNEHSNFMTFGDGKMEYINYHSHSIEHVYENPGVYYPRIYIAKEFKSTITVIATSEGWEYRRQINWNVNKNIDLKKRVEFSQNNLINYAKLSKDSNHWITISKYEYFRPILDSSEITMLIRNEIPNRHNSLTLEFSGTKAKITIQLRDSLADFEGFVGIGSNKFYTSHKKTPEFFVNFKEWGKLQIKVSNQMAEITTPGHKPKSFNTIGIIGQLRGIQIVYFGKFEIDYLKIFNSTQNVSSNYDF